MRAVYRLAVVATSIAGLSACAITDRIEHVAAAIGQAYGHIRDHQSAFVQAIDDPSARLAAQRVEQPWLAGRAQPLAREVTLPLALRADVNTTLMFADGAMDLPRLAQRITAATGIPVHVRPDALLPQAAFLPRLTDIGAPALEAPATVLLGDGPEPLARMLDRVAARLGVQWRYEHGRIEFYRTETRVFSVRALTLNASAQAALGKTGQHEAQGFISTSQTQLESPEHDVLAVVKARIEPFLTRAGVLVAEAGASASIVVTDTPDVLQKIAIYLDQENRALTRRVRLLFEELTVAMQDGVEVGVDWNLVFSSAKVAATLLSPAAGTSADAGGLGIALTDGPFSGSEAVIRALNDVGKVVRRNSLPVLTLNRRPITHAVRTTFSYIDRIETTAVASGTGLALPSIAVSQREETVGSILTLVPDAQEDGQILLSVAYDNTVAQPLKSVTFGDRNNPLQLQQITIDGNGTVQQVALQPGQPLVISGFDRTRDETSERRLNPGMPLALGGSDRASSQQLTTIMVVTAQLEEGF